MSAAERQPAVTPTSVLNAAREELVAETRAGRGGTAAVGQFAAHLDGLLQQVFAAAGPTTRPAALLALGGYGRRQLCLHSDVDLLVLFGGTIGPEDEQFVRRLLNPLWDLGLVLGHQVRELADLAHLETDNPEFLLALLDARLVAGDATVFDRFNTAFHVPETHAFIVASLTPLIAQRHAQFNDTLYQLEPDIKDAPGALRDLMALRVISQLTDPSLIDHGPAERVQLDEAEDFLIRIRSLLHLEARRNQNTLTHELQERAGEILGYPGVNPRQRVERLMSDYFKHARIVNRSLEWIRRASPQPVGVNLVRAFNGIRFVDERMAAREPHTWLRVFQAAIDLDTGAADEALALIQQDSHAYEAGDFFPTPATVTALLRFLKPRPGLYARLSEMHDCGLLGRMFPEFRGITHRVVRDFYHKYTVDEHTLLTIRNLERLHVPSPQSRERFASLLTDLASPELLVLSLLFHDVGKWRDEDHHLESVRMARTMMERLNLTAESRDTIEFLVQHHIAMSLVAFRRDTEDPEIVRNFAGLVGTEERLKLLTLMTLVDVEAVSPDTLTPWREELLWRLYVDTYNQLTLAYGDDVIAEDKVDLTALLAGRARDLSESEIRRFVEGLPRRYLQLFSHDAIYRHVQLSRNISADHVHATLEPRGDAWELTVVTLDKPFLFSNICGVLSAYGMDILRGHALTNPNGLVLDIFQFTDAERYLEMNADGRARLLEVLEAVVSGRSDIAPRLRARERGVHSRRGVPRFPTVIHCDNQSSRRYSIMDIIANNAIGLLHRISRVISRHGCDVDLVLISTEGEKAIDVFHITQGGTKLTPAAQEALAAELKETLEENHEAH
jgi:[protein-PII] uridylyltransferase